MQGNSEVNILEYVSQATFELAAPDWEMSSEFDGQQGIRFNLPDLMEQDEKSTVLAYLRQSPHIWDIITSSKPIGSESTVVSLDQYKKDRVFTYKAILSDSAPADYSFTFERQMNKAVEVYAGKVGAAVLHSMDLPAATKQ